MPTPRWELVCILHVFLTYRGSRHLRTAAAKYRNNSPHHLDVLFRPAVLADDVVVDVVVLHRVRLDHSAFDAFGLWKDGLAHLVQSPEGSCATIEGHTTKISRSRSHRSSTVDHLDPPSQWSSISSAVDHLDHLNDLFTAVQEERYYTAFIQCHPTRQTCAQEVRSYRPQPATAVTRSYSISWRYWKTDMFLPQKI